MENKIGKFEKKENNYFKYLLEVLELLISSTNLSQDLECEANCQSLKLNYIQVGVNFFSSFEIFGIKSEKCGALYSNIEQIYNIMKEENNMDKKKVIELCFKNISIIINEIISVCEQNLSKTNQFINSIIESSTSCENEIKTIDQDKKKLDSEIEKLKDHQQSKIKHFFFPNTTDSKYDEFKINSKSKEIKEKNNSIDNIRIIIKNFGSIEKKIKLNIVFFESIKNSWLSINEKFKNVSNNLNNSNEWISGKMDEILQYINKLKEQLNSNEMEKKTLENQFNTLLYTKDANIENC